MSHGQSADTVRPVPSEMGARPGVSIVILSYERMKGLKAVLGGLLEQKPEGLGIEVMICNNSARRRLTSSMFTGIGRYVSKFPAARIFNCSDNWGSRVRYSIATLSQYQTIMFLDDDLVLTEPYFVRYMWETLHTLSPVDILSCWNTIWVQWDEDYFTTVSMNFKTPHITEVTESDTAGCGICMFNKRILLSGKIANRSDNFPITSDMDFSLLAHLEWGSRSYFLPSGRMLTLHKEYQKNALYPRYGEYRELYGRYRTLLAQGYEPVITRTAASSPEVRSRVDKAVREIKPVRHRWKEASVLQGANTVPDL